MARRLVAVGLLIGERAQVTVEVGPDPGDGAVRRDGFAPHQLYPELRVSVLDSTFKQAARAAREIGPVAR